MFDTFVHPKIVILSEAPCKRNSTQTQNASPTSQLLMDYEEHLRNTLEKGLDAESYSLHTFESLLTRSMENLGKSI